MKHNVKITIVLVILFFIAQLMGLFVTSIYSQENVPFVDEEGIFQNASTYNLPYGMDPPTEMEPSMSVFSIMIALFIAVTLMLLLMKFNAAIFLKIWFLVVVVLGIALALNATLISFENSALIALAIAIPLGIIKIFQRNLIVHNATELLIYPGIAAVFIPLLSIPTTVFLLILISLYDMYAVWHAGFMQKMAKYQIQKLKIFSGFFVPYLDKKQRLALKKAKKSKSQKGKQIKVNVAILGGGDVVFPILLAGTVLHTMGLTQALIISVGATMALTGLFMMSQKGKFYPAMPFISAGCLIALAIAYII
jgi:presenilin-like A22 family membrane protease|tara:strand:- start:1327 stop:2250 length:924 start_codon:yes stop_codon:yes gene_type:complete